MRLKVKILLINFLLVGLFALAACKPATPMQIVPTETKNPTPISTLTPLSTPTPTQNPLSISTDNASEMVKLAEWGKGKPTGIEWAPDGSTLAISTSIGTYFLDGETLEEILLLESDTEVSSMLFSPDGTKIAMSGCRSHDLNLVCNWSWVKIVDVETGEEILTSDPGSRNEPFLRFSPSGKYLIGAGCAAERGVGVHCIEGKISIWNSSNGELVRELIGHNNWVNDIAFSPHGEYIASSSAGNLMSGDPGTVIVWNMVTGAKKITIFEDEPVAFNFVTFDKTGSVLITGNGKGQVGFYGAENGKKLDSIPEIDRDKIADLFLRYKPLNDLIIREDDETIQVWNKDGALQSRFSLPPGSLDWVISPDQERVAGFTGSNVFIMDIDAEKLTRHIDWETPNLETNGILPDGRWVVAGSCQDQKVCVFDAISGEQLQIFPVNPDGVIEISPDGVLIAISRYSGEAGNQGFSIFEIESGKELFSDTSEIYTFAFSPDSQALATGGDRGQLRLWNISDAQNATFTSLIGHQQTDSEGWGVGVTEVSFTPDEKYLISGSWDSNINIWEISTNSLVYTINDCFSVFFMLSPDGKRLVYTDSHNINRMLFFDISPFVDVPFSETQAPFVLDDNYLKSGFLFHPNGQLFAFGRSSSYSDPASITLLDLQENKSVTQFDGHNKWVGFLAFSPDGQYLLSNGYDGMTHLWGIKP
ncbi:MAG: WD40 repeat domain-containing protein [Anaerolineaceae bacterium]|nr:WD40 repeat domain-containing protein [Anaerolineaceae bacterium]